MWSRNVAAHLLGGVVFPMRKSTRLHVARGLRRCRVDAGHECDGYRHLSADRQREPFTLAPFASAFSSRAATLVARAFSPWETDLMNDLTPDETEAILTLCLMAAFADGEKHEREREQIRKIAESFRGSEVDLSALYQEVLLRKPEPAAVAARLTTPGARQLAYELALAVCDAADARSVAEQQFLTRLHSALALSPAETDTAVEEVRALTAVPAAAAAPPPIPSQPQPASTAQAEATDAMILRYATIAGALELLPQTMATLAIVPLQTKLVYQIAKERGFDPDCKSLSRSRPRLCAW